VEEIEIEDFYDDDRLQERYTNRVMELRTWLKKSYDSEYHDEVMLQQVKGIARSEIQVEMLERLVANEMEGEQTNMQLSRERAHLQTLRQNLRMHLRQLRPESYQVQHSLSKDFREFAYDVLSKELEVEEDND